MDFRALTATAAPRPYDGGAAAMAAIMATAAPRRLAEVGDPTVLTKTYRPPAAAPAPAPAPTAPAATGADLLREVQAAAAAAAAAAPPPATPRPVTMKELRAVLETANRLTWPSWPAVDREHLAAMEWAKGMVGISTPAEANALLTMAAMRVLNSLPPG